MVKNVLKASNQEQTLWWYLSEGDGSIRIWAQDDQGGTWCVLAVGPDGKVWRTRRVPNDIGLVVDAEGRLVVKDL